MYSSFLTCDLSRLCIASLCTHHFSPVTYPDGVLHHYVLIISHPISSFFLLETGTLGTSREDTLRMSRGDSNSQPLGYKPSALATELNSSKASAGKELSLSYLLTNWLAYLYGRIQSPRPDVMPDRREGITRAAGFVFACIDTQTS